MRAKGRCKLDRDVGMPGVGLTALWCRKARPDGLALKPHWGKLTVRNFREGDGYVGIMRSPNRAIAPPDQPAPARITLTGADVADADLTVVPK